MDTHTWFIMASSLLSTSALFNYYYYYYYDYYYYYYYFKSANDQHFLNPVHSCHIDSLQHLMIENIKQRLPSAVTSWSTENDMPPNFVPETPIATKPSVCGPRSLLKSSMRVEIANPKKTHCAPWFFFMMRSS